MYGAPRRACSGSGSGSGCGSGSGSGCGGRVRSLLMLTTALLLSAAGLLSALPGVTEAKECDKPCVNGQCNAATGSCACLPGWVGDQCQHCGGRFRYDNGATQGGWRLVKSSLLWQGACQDGDLAIAERASINMERGGDGQQQQQQDKCVLLFLMA
ncbi:Attractin [Liparis tanakae]|uniref:Attractin n=1 Tax=Liparis tanakae TaxID=230148 RepID=A0A4Z2FFG7_9TELE|nr:Attractin [Liparis tanakae]